jgi:hypothetical protein
VDVPKKSFARVPDGNSVGDPVGALEMDGIVVGCCERVGAVDKVGVLLGFWLSVGPRVGLFEPVGDMDDADGDRLVEGEEVGTSLRSTVGALVGDADGLSDGDELGGDEGKSEGADVGGLGGPIPETRNVMVGLDSEIS